MISNKLDKYIEITKQYFPEKAINTCHYDSKWAELSLDGSALSPDFNFIFLIYKLESNTLFTPYTIDLHYYYNRLELVSLDKTGNLANTIRDYNTIHPTPEQFAAECARLASLIKKGKELIKLKRIENDF